MTTEIYKEDGKVYRKVTTIKELELPEAEKKNLDEQIAGKQEELNRLQEEKEALVKC